MLGGDSSRTWLLDSAGMMNPSCMEVLMLTAAWRTQNNYIWSQLKTIRWCIFPTPTMFTSITLLDTPGFMIMVKNQLPCTQGQAHNPQLLPTDANTRYECLLFQLHIGHMTSPSRFAVPATRSIGNTSSPPPPTHTHTMDPRRCCGFRALLWNIHPEKEIALRVLSWEMRLEACGVILVVWWRS